MNTKTTFRPRTLGLLVTALLAAGLFSGCGGDRYYVWNMRDIIGLWFWVIVIVATALWYVADVFVRWLRRNFRKPCR